VQVGDVVYADLVFAQVIVDAARVFRQDFGFRFGEEVRVEIVDHIFFKEVLKPEKHDLVYVFVPAFSRRPIRIDECRAVWILSSVIEFIAVCEQ
jgi:hypothetical protein